MWEWIWKKWRHDKLQVIYRRSHLYQQLQWGRQQWFVGNRTSQLNNRGKQFIALTSCFLLSMQNISSLCISFITWRSSDSSSDIPLSSSSCRLSVSFLPGASFLLELSSKAAKVMTSNDKPAVQFTGADLGRSWQDTELIRLPRSCFRNHKGRYTQEGKSLRSVSAIGSSDNSPHGTYLVLCKIAVTMTKYIVLGTSRKNSNLLEFVRKVAGSMWHSLIWA